VKKYIEIYKKEFTIIIVILIAIILIYIISFFTSSKDENKIFNHEDYIIEKEKFDDENGKYVLPYINIENKKVKEINKKIIEDYYKVKLTNNGTFDYLYTKKDKFISLLTISSFFTDGDSSQMEYNSYNIDVENNKVLSNEDVLKIYNYDIEYVKEIIKNKMYSYYQFEIDNNYIEKLYTFEDYLTDRDLTIDDNFNIYIDEDNKLKVYKTFNLSYAMTFDEYFLSNPYEFEIN